MSCLILNMCVCEEWFFNLILSQFSFEKLLLSQFIILITLLNVSLKSFWNSKCSKPARWCNYELDLEILQCTVLHLLVKTTAAVILKPETLSRIQAVPVIGWWYLTTSGRVFGRCATYPCGRPSSCRAKTGSSPARTTCRCASSTTTRWTASRPSRPTRTTSAASPSTPHSPSSSPAVVCFSFS